MEIIKKGQVKNYRMACTDCNTIFKFSKNETYIGISSLQEYIKCPICETYLYLHKVSHAEITTPAVKSKEKKYKSFCSYCEQEHIITDKDFKVWIFGLYYQCPGCKTSIRKGDFELCPSSD